MKFIISHKDDGTMQFVGGDIALANREKFLIMQRIKREDVVAGQLVNGANVQIVTREVSGKMIMATDGLITTDPSLWLSITVADCLPIVVFNDEVVSILHCGWRGIDGGIIEVGIDKIRKELKINSELKAYIGPGIAQHHYPVMDEVADKFKSYDSVITRMGENKYLDLRAVAKHKLKDLGVNEIEINEECTYCDAHKYLSARRDRTSPVEAMMCVVRI